MLLASSLAALLALPAAQSSPKPAPFPWGGDVNPGAGQKLVDSVPRELLALIRAPDSARPARASELARKRAVVAIEAWKRFRNPELVELERACLRDPDWHVVHRALHWGRSLRDPVAAEVAWSLLDDPRPRLREKAAITCLELWDGGASRPLAERIGRERDFHVRQALLALQRRMAGELTPRRPDGVADEVVVERDDGLRWAPFLRGWNHLAEVAPGVAVATASEPSSRSAAELPIATRWNAPLLGFGDEEVPRIVLQPFGKPRQGGALLHTGRDAGGCLDGAGLYALADGVVRWITAGSDMGTGIVVEHQRADGELVNAVYMHAGTLLFVAAGEEVKAGQLLGTMGLSFSIENGGQFAHLHLGLYPGPFRIGHNYGYRPAAEGLDDWFDPAEVLPRWIAGGGQ